MIPKTVHCRLTAPEPIRRHLWHLMAERNTPLINALLKEVSQHSEFENWQNKGNISDATVKTLCNKLKASYPSQPSRFYTSATLMVSYIYESWLALHKNHRYRLEGKQRRLNIIESGAELCKLSGFAFDAIQHQAREILNQLGANSEAQPSQGQTPKDENQQKSRSSGDKQLIARLFEMHEEIDDPLSRCAVAHLIRNNGSVAEAEEDPEKFAHYICRKHEEIEILEARLQARLPKGRDLTGEEFLETLATVAEQVSQNVRQAEEWQAKLLTRPALLPYPLIYGSAAEVFWGRKSNGKISVSFSGLATYLKQADPTIKEWFKTHKEYPFQICCGQRQLHYFERFLHDWEDRKKYKKEKKNYPDGLLTLRSVTLGWREGKGKGKPWNVHHLAFYCTFDTRLMSAEGTLEVQQEKLAKARKALDRPKPDPRIHSTIARLQNIPVRPSRKPYRGNPEILVGVSIGLADPITAVVVNGRTGEVLAHRTSRALLTKKHYLLLNRQRQRQQQNLSERRKNQQKGITYQPTDEELGQHVDRHFAKAVTDLAKRYGAGSIVIPNLTHTRDLLTSEIRARAQRKCPGSEQAQKKYAKEYQMSIHRWSYKRLIGAICGKANQLGIDIESGFQVAADSLLEQARDIAIAAYHLRKTSQKS